MQYCEENTSFFNTPLYDFIMLDPPFPTRIGLNTATEFGHFVDKKSQEKVFTKIL